MSFSNWSDFFHMGGYAVYVWGAYGLTLAVLGTLVAAVLRRHRRLLRALDRRQRRAQPRATQQLSQVSDESGST